MRLRVGHGFDVHAFGSGDHITLGGIHIPFKKGIIAHSDGDVLLHALCDAILGALSLGDIGEHFPDTDAQYKGVNSLVLLRTVYALALTRGWQLSNADITVVADAPKITPYKSSMVSTIAAALNVAPDQINIKGTTSEKLGFVGRNEGLAVHATVLLTTAQ